jgi:DNA invertase Pin-like site-specific DNA recombinase
MPRRSPPNSQFDLSNLNKAAIVGAHQDSNVDAKAAAPLNAGAAAAFCVVYCRVSSAKQMTEGDGLKSQERACRAYAQAKGYTVLAVFQDGLTGGTDARPGFVELLTFLDTWRSPQVPGAMQGEMIVLVDDIKRFARGVEVHFDLKAEVSRRGGRLESPNFKFEDTPEGKFVETVIAAQAELERNQNKRQVVSRMKARMEQGYWVFNPPPGYRFQAHRLHKRLLVPDGQRAQLAKEALERYAAGLLLTMSDIERFLTRSGFFGPDPERRSLSVRLTQIAGMLRNILYTGHVAYPPWGITLRKGQHEGLITLTTFERIQERLHERAAGRAPVPLVPGPAVPEQLPLRGLVRCNSCDRPLTGSLSRGQHGVRYPYYHCVFGNCPQYGKTIRAQALNDGFEQLLQGLTATDVTMAVVRAALLDEVGKRVGQQHERRHMARIEAEEIGRKIEDLGEKIELATSPAVLRILEGRVEQLAGRKLTLEAEAANDLGGGPTAEDAGTLFDAVASTLRSPYRTWKFGDVKTRRNVARAVFPDSIRYERGRGFGTPNYALPYRITTTLAGSSSLLVDPTGISWNEVIATLLWWRSFGRTGDSFPQPPSGISAALDGQ